MYNYPGSHQSTYDLIRIPNASPHPAESSRFESMSSLETAQKQPSQTLGYSKRVSIQLHNAIEEGVETHNVDTGVRSGRSASSVSGKV